MPQLMASPLIVLASAGVALLAIAVPLWRMLLVYRGADTRRPFDASDLRLQPTAQAGEVLAALSRLGFERLGEAQLDIPGARAVELSATAQPRVTGAAVDRHTVFVMVDPSRTIVAEVAQVPHAKPIVSLNTLFADSSVVETMYPRGESIHDHDFHSGHSTRSLDRAYDDQRVEVDRWRSRHGTPRSINTMADYLRSDAVYRERYAKRKLRGPLVRRQLVPSVAFALVVVVFALAAMLRWPV